MITLTPLPPVPRVLVTPPAPQHSEGDVTICNVGGAIRIDMYGEVHGSRVAAILTRDQAINLARALGRMISQANPARIRK